MTGLRRRTFLTGALALGTLALARSAYAAPDDATSRAIGWLIGDNLSLAGLVYAQGAAPADVSSYFDKARGLGANIGVVIPDLPPQEGNENDTLVSVIHFLIKGEGWQAGQLLAQGIGPQSAALFEVAIKSNLLLVLYEPGNDNGIGPIIQARLAGILPVELWQPAVDAIAAKQSADDVSAAILKMHSDIGSYLVKAMG